MSKYIIQDATTKEIRVIQGAAGDEAWDKANPTWDVEELLSLFDGRGME